MGAAENSRGWYWKLVHMLIVSVDLSLFSLRCLELTEPVQGGDNIRKKIIILTRIAH